MGETTISEALYEELTAACLQVMDLARTRLLPAPSDADTILLGHAAHIRAVLWGEEASPGVGTCVRCRGLSEWVGDAPLPHPIVLGSKGLTEHHCGFDGSKSPRFTYVCPDCGNKNKEDK